MISFKFVCEKNAEVEGKGNKIDFVSKGEEPTGTITLGIKSKDIAERFIEGKTYSVDFSAVKEEE